VLAFLPEKILDCTSRLQITAVNHGWASSPDGNLKNHRHKEKEQGRRGEEVIGVKVPREDQEDGATGRFKGGIASSTNLPCAKAMKH
jgi:hypothetical protein